MKIGRLKRFCINLRIDRAGTAYMIDTYNGPRPGESFLNFQRRARHTEKELRVLGRLVSRESSSSSHAEVR